MMIQIVRIYFDLKKSQFRFIATNFIRVDNKQQNNNKLSNAMYIIYVLH